MHFAHTVVSYPAAMLLSMLRLNGLELSMTMLVFKRADEHPDVLKTQDERDTVLQAEFDVSFVKRFEPVAVVMVNLLDDV